MSPNLPAILPSASHPSVSSSGFLPRPETRVSISDNGSQNKISSSVNSNNSKPRTSVNSKVVDNEQEELDNRRYAVGQKALMKKKQLEQQKTSSQQSKKSLLAFDLKTKTGRIVSTKKIMKRLYLLKKNNPVTFAPLDREDLKKVIDLVKSHPLRPGRGYGRLARVSMKRKVEGWRSKGDFNLIESKLAKRIVDNLPHDS